MKMTVMYLDENDRIYIQMNHIQTNVSAPTNTANLGTTYSNIQTAQSCPSLVGIEPAMH